MHYVCIYCGQLRLLGLRIHAHMYTSDLAIDYLVIFNEV